MKNRTYYRWVNESFGPNEVKEVLYTGGRNLRDFNCSLTAMPLTNKRWGYVGTLTYLNTGSSREVEVTALLIDSQTGETVGTFNQTVKFNAGQKRSIRYSFEDADRYRGYILGLGVVDGLEFIENESTNPTIEDARFLAVFC